jgi:hypothetical protein
MTLRDAARAASEFSPFFQGRVVDMRIDLASRQRRLNAPVDMSDSAVADATHHGLAHLRSP